MSGDIASRRPITGAHVIVEGDVCEVLRGFDANTFDACFCDPPYLISFMSKPFDKQHRTMSGANDGQKMQAWHEAWCREVYRVLKPGAFLLAFGGTRSYHRLASAAEDTGFEVRDCLAFAWVYGQGFPKSLDIGKSASENWKGYGTALKPSMEPLVLAMKPTQGTFAANALMWGVAGLAIDASRIGTADKYTRPQGYDIRGDNYARSDKPSDLVTESHAAGRWPANVLLAHHEDCREVGTRRVKSSTLLTTHNLAESENNSMSGKNYARNPRRDYAPDGMEEVTAWECHPECPVRMLDEQAGGDRGTSKPGAVVRQKRHETASMAGSLGGARGQAEVAYGDYGGVSRFFYTSKVSTRERNLGGIDCRHATLKPMSLTEYLSRLLLPPVRTDNSLRQLLIPFSGAGSEIVGALRAGWDLVIGIENDAESVQWAEARIAAAVRETETGIREPSKGRRKAAAVETGTTDVAEAESIGNEA